MARRSESPEGVGDLLKQDSFGYEEEEVVQDMADVVEQNGADEAPEAQAEVEADAMQGVQSKDNTSASSGPKAVARANGAASSSGGVRSKLRPSLKGKGPARYFIIKSNTPSNIETSVKNGIWATQRHNEDKLNDAFHSATAVYLIFSVNMSGHFQGYARMISRSGRNSQAAWEGNATVSNTFNVEWLRRYDLPFRETEHLTNPLNENKPVKISRDGQELPLPLGMQLCKMFDQGADAAGIPRPEPPVRIQSQQRSGPPPSGPPMGGRMGGGMGRGRGRGMEAGMEAGMVMTPMGPMPAHMAMGMSGAMGMGHPMVGPMAGFGPGMMMDDGMGMMGMGVAAPGMGMGMQGMHPMMMMGPGMVGPGMMGMPGPGGFPGVRGPAPPSQPPPPKAPPPPARKSPEDDLRKMLNGMRGGSRSSYDSRPEEMLLRLMEQTRRGSPPRRRHRSRSRSESPRRGRSRRRSRSRSRSRSHGRSRHAVADMSYEEYLEAFQAMRRNQSRSERESSRPSSRGAGDARPNMGAGVNPGIMPAQMGSGGSINPLMVSGRGGMAAGAMAGGMPGQMGAGGMNPMMSQMGGMAGGAAPAAGTMSEEAYVQVWENYTKMMGKPFDAATVRGWYRQYKNMLAQQK